MEQLEKNVEIRATGRYPTIEDYVGETPLVRLQRLPGKTSNVILCKLEGNNPAGSVKDRPALSMIQRAEEAGVVKPGDTLIEATSGNTGIALAMAAAIKGYKLKLIMPSNMSQERKDAMAAYGAELISVPAGQMEMARDLAKEMESNGEGVVLDQFGNSNNPLGHYHGTGPEVYRQTNGNITHFVSSMGTTGTIMGTSRYLKGVKPEVQIVGLQPAEGASIAGIRRWSEEYLPKIFDSSRVDTVMEITQEEAEEAMRAAARVEGIFCGVSSGGAISAALRLSAQVENAVIVCIICDRGDRYLSTGVFSAKERPRPTNTEGFFLAVQRLKGLRNLYVLFTSDDDPETGRPWCPDCERANDAVAQVFSEREDYTLLICRVGPRVGWKRPAEHPFRSAPLHLTGIPTLVQWSGDDGPGPQLGAELEACTSSQEVETLTRQFLSR